MKQLLLFLLVMFPFCLTAQSCDPSDETLTNGTEHPLLPSDSDEGEEDDTNTGDNGNDNTNNDMNDKIIISVGDVRYAATLEDNPAARAFAALLPMTVVMTEMNGNEKYASLSGNLPTDTFRPGTIHAGDLLLWGTDTVVLFYETFSSSYSYTRLGEIDNPEGLAAALGNGNVTVAFSGH